MTPIICYTVIVEHVGEPLTLISLPAGGIKVYPNYLILGSVTTIPRFTTSWEML